MAQFQVAGYRELLRACDQAGEETERFARETFRKVGETVRGGAAGRILPKSARTAGGYRTIVRQRGIAVEQSVGKTTGAHREWGSYQMRHALLPALRQNEDLVWRDMEEAMDRVARGF